MVDNLDVNIRHTAQRLDNTLCLLSQQIHFIAQVLYIFLQVRTSWRFPISAIRIITVAAITTTTCYELL